VKSKNIVYSNYRGIVFYRISSNILLYKVISYIDEISVEFYTIKYATLICYNLQMVRKPGVQWNYTFAIYGLHKRGNDSEGKKCSIFLSVWQLDTVFERNV
jgi:hypothetical protein